MKVITSADLILTSDWHLRDDQPPCRTDDFEEAQWMKVCEIAQLQQDYGCPILHAGDLFHHWKPSPYLISKAIYYLPDNFFSVAGQHDLPQHNLDLFDKSGMNTLVQAKAVKWIAAGNFGQEVGLGFQFPGTKVASASFAAPTRRVGVLHRFVWNGKEWPWPECQEKTAKEILKENPDFDLIVTGDYHRPFTYEYRGRLLVNCGCLTRQVADYADHRPRVWLWDAASNTVRPEYLVAQKGVISRDHIEVQEEKNKRLEAFISRLTDEWEVSVSFEENLKRFISSNRVRKSVVDLVYKAMES